VDFERLCATYRAGAFFIRRAKAGMDVQRVCPAPTDRTSGVVCDQRTTFNGFCSARNQPEHLRRVRFKDPESDKTPIFVINNTSLARLADHRAVQEPLAGRVRRSGAPSPPTRSSPSSRRNFISMLAGTPVCRSCRSRSS